jgi:hypothetical protein
MAEARHRAIRRHQHREPSRGGGGAAGERCGEGWRAMAPPQPFRHRQHIQQQAVIAGGDLGEAAIRRHQPRQGGGERPRAMVAQRRIAEQQAAGEQPGGLADAVVVVLRPRIMGGGGDAAGMQRQEGPRARGRRMVLPQQRQGQGQMQRPQRRFLPAGPMRPLEGRVGDAPFRQTCLQQGRISVIRPEAGGLRQARQAGEAPGFPDRTHIAGAEKIHPQGRGRGIEGAMIRRRRQPSHFLTQPCAPARWQRRGGWRQGAGQEGTLWHRRVPQPPCGLA